jgi:protein dithiol oxidoreductase (disulfide-forming)
MIRLVGLALLLLACAAPQALAQETIRARQNLEYRLIAPQPVETAGKIEVIDFFWYGCPACNALQPALEAWIKRKPADVVVRRIPAIFRESWVPHVRIYYALERLGELDRLHQRVYFSYHVEELALSKPEVAELWATRNGIDRQKWLDAYNSPEVAARIEQAKALTAAYDVRGTPTLVVNGRYLTAWDMADQTPVVLVAILEDLVRLSRQKPSGG